MYQIFHLWQKYHWLVLSWQESKSQLKLTINSSSQATQGYYLQSRGEIHAAYIADANLESGVQNAMEGCWIIFDHVCVSFSRPFVEWTVLKNFLSWHLAKTSEVVLMEDPKNNSSNMHLMMMLLLLLIMIMMMMHPSTQTVTTIWQNGGWKRKGQVSLTIEDCIWLQYLTATQWIHVESPIYLFEPDENELVRSQGFGPFFTVSSFGTEIDVVQ